MSTVNACPFCGYDDPEIDEIEVGIWALCCPECRAIGPHCDGRQSPEAAIMSWNKRHEVAPA